MSEIIKELRGNNDTHNTNSPQLDDAYAKSQEEYCRTVRSSVKSGRSKQSSSGGIKLRHQPGLKDHLAGAEARGLQQFQSEEDRATATLRLSQDATGAVEATTSQA